MKNIVLSALALAAAAGAANAQTIEYQWTERHNQSAIGPGAVVAASDNFNGAGAATDATIWLVLSARIVGAPSSVIGLAGGAGQVIAGDGGDGSRGAFRLTGTFNSSSASATSSPGWTGFVDGLGDPVGNGRGVFNPFRLVAQISGSETAVTGTAGSVGGNDSLNDIVFATGGAAVAGLDAGSNQAAQWGNNAAGTGAGPWIPVYTFQYNVTDLTARDITFSALMVMTAFDQYDPSTGVPNQIQYANILPPSYTVTITPAPGAAALLGLGGLLAARRRRA